MKLQEMIVDFTGKVIAVGILTAGIVYMGTQIELEFFKGMESDIQYNQAQHIYKQRVKEKAKHAKKVLKKQIPLDMSIPELPDTPRFASRLLDYPITDYPTPNYSSINMYEIPELSK